MRFILTNEYKNVFTVDGYNPQKSIAAFEKLDKQKQNDFDVIQGHAALAFRKYIENPILLTYLRDPVDCFISQYYYIKRSPHHRSYKALATIDSIEKYIDFANEHGEDNIQTRFLSDSLLSNFGPLGTVSISMNKNQLLHQAKEKLQTFDYVFFTRQFDQSLMILQKDLNWPRPPYYYKINQTSKRPQKGNFSNNVLEKIKDVVRYDVELFEFAKPINEMLLSEYKIDKELAVFRHRNALMKNVTWMRHYKDSAHARIMKLFRTQS